MTGRGFLQVLVHEVSHLRRVCGGVGAQCQPHRPALCVSLSQVMYQKDHTGFEESKDFPITLNALIAGG